MSFFSVLKVDGSTQFSVSKLDINLWVLPGLLSQEVLLCDIGVRLQLVGQVDSATPLIFDLSLPFYTYPDGLTDLIPHIRDQPTLFNLIFGETGSSPQPDGDSWVYNDGDGVVLLQSLDLDDCSQRLIAEKSVFSLWRISVGRAIVPENSVVYMRFRFRIRKGGLTWSWQKGERRRSHAICDLRVNELRDKPQLDKSPDFANRTMPIARVNCFTVVPARHKAGRISPAPKYVRILEGEAWAPYLLRRLSRSGEPFVITYWPKFDKQVTPGSPFRAFQEVERRRPTAGRSSLLLGLGLVAFIVLLQSKGSLEASILYSSLYTVYSAVLGLLTISVVLGTYRLVVPFVAGGRWRALGRQMRKLESRRYRQ